MSSGSDGEAGSQNDFPAIRIASYVVIVLMLCNTLSFINRKILGLLVTPIKQQLGISDTNIGLLQGLHSASSIHCSVCQWDPLPIVQAAVTWSPQRSFLDFDDRGMRDPLTLTAGVQETLT